MNKEWSEDLKLAIKDIGSKDNFKKGINELIEFRNELAKEVNLMLDNDSKYLNACPYMNRTGYECKTIFYSFYHIARIEDICFNILINKDVDVLTKGNYKERINLKIVTTGNELVKEEIVDFSTDINVEEFRKYFNEVISSTNTGLLKLEKTDLKTKFNEHDYSILMNSNFISQDERAIWLIDFWTQKDVFGLIKMPFSRHLIMHIEAALRIRNEMVRLENKKRIKVN